MGGDLEMQYLVNANANIPVGIPGQPNYSRNNPNDSMNATKLLDSSTLTAAPAIEPTASKKQALAKKGAPVAKGKKAVTESDSGSEEDSSEEEGKALNKKGKAPPAKGNDSDSDASTVRSRA